MSDDNNDHDQALQDLAAWSRFIGKALVGLAVASVLLLLATVGGLLALRASVQEEEDGRDRDRCVTETYGPSIAVLLQGLVELDASGTITSETSEALVEQAEMAASVAERCATD